MVQIEMDLAHAKELQACIGTEHRKLELEQTRLEFKRDALARVARKLVGEADELENKLEFHPHNKTLKMIAAKMRLVAERAVKKAINASSVASVLGR